MQANEPCCYDIQDDGQQDGHGFVNDIVMRWIGIVEYAGYKRPSCYTPQDCHDKVKKCPTTVDTRNIYRPSYRPLLHGCGRPRASRYPELGRLRCIRRRLI